MNKLLEPVVNLALPSHCHEEAQDIWAGGPGHLGKLRTNDPLGKSYLLLHHGRLLKHSHGVSPV